MVGRAETGWDLQGPTGLSRCWRRGEKHYHTEEPTQGRQIPIMFGFEN